MSIDFFTDFFFATLYETSFFSIHLLSKPTHTLDLVRSFLCLFFGLVLGISYWHSVEEDRPVAFGATTFMGPTKSVYSNYQEGVADPPKGWELPSIDGVDCDAECTRRSPSGEEDRPELHPETLAILMAEYNRRFGGY